MKAPAIGLPISPLDTSAELVSTVTAKVNRLKKSFQRFSTSNGIRKRGSFREGSMSAGEVLWGNGR
jgi:hypothetical protein